LVSLTKRIKRRKWKESELRRRAKSVPEKLALADRLRRETTLTLPQVAERLQMGSWKSLNSKLYRWRRAGAAPSKLVETRG